uniref:[RNA-polymerase]-subunit kinase n=1 Tax=Aegilops tauschii TaxID=37682 RepID=M8BNV3_AEGTA
MRQLLSGAGRMHERGIVHRDIKPGNVLVGGQGVVKICDLGLAVSMASAPPPRGRAGTRWYMAPEMLLGRPDYDELVDAWLLGCVMAELLTGETLFPGQNAVDQLLRISSVLGGACVGFAHAPLAVYFHSERHDTARRLRELFPEERLSRGGFEVLEGLLACDPGERLPAAMAPPTSQLQPRRMRARPPFYLITWECISIPPMYDR